MFIKPICSTTNWYYKKVSKNSESRLLKFTFVTDRYLYLAYILVTKYQNSKVDARCVKFCDLFWGSIL